MPTSSASSRAGRRRHDSLDILVHALAFAKREDLTGEFVDTSRDGFALALDVSRLLAGRARARCAPAAPATASSIMTLTYYGADKVIANYNVMGVAKAALEASRPLPRGRPRPGGHPGQRHQRRTDPDARRRRRRRASRRCTALFDEVAPLRRNVSIEDVGGAARLPGLGPVERRDRRGHVRRRRLQRDGRAQRGLGSPRGTGPARTACAPTGSCRPRSRRTTRPRPSRRSRSECRAAARGPSR